MGSSNVYRNLSADQFNYFSFPGIFLWPKTLCSHRLSLCIESLRVVELCLWDGAARTFVMVELQRQC